MRYAISHTTVYTYQTEVSASHHVARLSPRQAPGQYCVEHSLFIDPHPTHCETRRDYFGNDAVFFNLEHPYRELTVIARSLIDVDERQVELGLSSYCWEQVRDQLPYSASGSDWAAAYEFSLGSPLIPLLPAAAHYALPSFTPGRPLLDACTELMGRIFKDFKFDPSATTIATTIEEVLEKRRGVCQDFAQVQIACLRALGLPARYVSGYIETLPPPGKIKLVGADASHAWLSVYCPPLGWIDFDPTNNTSPHGQHITVAWGRDFSDISPLRGVFLGSGAHELKVAVDVNSIR